MRKLFTSVLFVSVLVSLTVVSLSDSPKKPAAPKPAAPDTGNGGVQRWEYLNERLDKAEARAELLQQQVLNAQHDAETAWIFAFSLADRIKKLADKIERVDSEDEL